MGKRFMALLLSICMLVSMVPAPAYAHDVYGDHPAQSGEIQMPAETEQISAPDTEINASASLSVRTLPDKVQYLVGEEIDLTGLMLNYFNGSATYTILVSDGITLVSGSTAAPGRATVTVKYSGLTTTFTVGVHEGIEGEFLQDESGYPESKHNYPNKENTTYTYQVEHAEYLKITFSTNTETENGYDYIYLYDGNDTLLGTYTGTQLSGKTIQVTGNTVKIKLTSDSDEREYGFSITSIYAYIKDLKHEKKDAGVYTEHTCTEDAYYSYTCYICDYTWIETVEGTAAHFMDSGVYTDPTCIAEGYTTYSCTACDYTNVVADTGSALGHTKDAGVYTDPCCFTDGYTTYTCTVCGTTEVVQDTGSAFHEFMNGSCIHCGVSEDALQGGWINDTVYWAMMPGNVLYIGGSGTVETGTWRNQAMSATSITFSEEITAIGNNAFIYMSNLASLRIPDHITQIGSGAFGYCTGLKYVYIPDSVVTVAGDSYNQSPFSGCSSSLRLYCEPASKPSGWGNYWYYYATYSSLYATFGMTEEDYLYWTTLDTSATTIEVPDYVTCVPQGAFDNNDTVRIIILGSGVTKIWYNTFRDCDALRYLFIPKSVKSVGSSFCYSCGADPRVYCEAASSSGWDSSWNSNVKKTAFNVTLEEFRYWSTVSGMSVTIPDYVRRIPSYAFSDSPYLTIVNIPDSVTAVDAYAFNNCDGLKKFVIGSGVTTIGKCAFYDCDGLESVYIPTSVETIVAGSYNSSPFYSCGSGLKIYCGAASAPSGWNSYWNYCASGTSLQVVYGTEAEYFDFWSGVDSSATEIVIPEGIISIPDHAFEDFINLTSVTIPGTVTYIGSNAFDGCTALTKVVIPEGVRTIGFCSFYNCSALASVTIPSTVTDISNSAFYGCSALEEVHVSDLEAWCNITFVNAYSNPLYYGNLYLNGTLVTDLVIPEGVTSVSEYAFGCPNLTSVTIPASVTFLGSDAFNGCTALEKVYISDLGAWCGIDFDGSRYANPLYYGDLYLDGLPVTELVIPDSVTKISAYAFYGATGITGITIPAGLTEVGSNAFTGCSNLSWMNILEFAAWCGVDFADYSANPLYYAKNLRVNGEEVSVLTIPEGVEYIGSYAFAGCKSVTEAIIPSWVESLHDGAFFACSNMTKVTLPEGLEEIGTSVFSGCASLSQINFPATLKTIGGSAFSNCGFTELNLPDGLESIGAYSFRNCSKLTAVNLPASLTAMEKNAFESCTKLTEIRIPEGITVLSGYTFSGCSALTEVTLPSTLLSVGNDCFYNCSSLTEITFPANLSGIGSNAFKSCTALTSIRFTGNAPTINTSAFASVKATVLYPYDASGWTDSVMQNYGGTLTWCSSTNSGIVAQGTCGEGVTWLLDEEGTLLISGSGAMADYSVSSTKTTAPWSAYVKSVKYLVVDSGVTYVGKYAFYGCSSLTQIRFLGSKPEISNYAFYGIRATAQYKANQATWIPGELGNYGGTITWEPIGMSEEYLGYSSLTDTYQYWKLDKDGTLWLHNWNINYNGYGSAPWYPYRHHLKKAVISGNTVGSLSFYSCTSLEEVVMDAYSVSVIGNYAFQDCTALKRVVMGERVTSIGKCAFYGCSSLESIFLPTDNSNLTVGDYAFGRCTSLKEASIPAGATFGAIIFEGCSNLKTIYISENDSGYSFNAASDTFSQVTATVYYPRKSFTSGNRQNYGGTLTWVEADFGTCGVDVKWRYDPEGQILTLSGTGAVCSSYFSGHDLPWGAFVNEILMIHVEEGIEIIPSYTFEYCESVQTITLPETLKSLALDAFNDCGSLNNLILPSSLENFRGMSNAGHPNFIRCESLSDVYYFGTEEEWALIEEAEYVQNAGRSMTIHFLIFDPGTATCTEPGAQPHYRYDDTSVYDQLYDLDRKPLSSLATVPALGHDLSDWAVTRESTCSVAGEEARSCSRCDHTETRALALKEHSFQDTVVEPDCENEGYTLHVCTVCAAEEKDGFVDALGHAFGSWRTTVEATCTEDGEQRRDCSRCDHSETKVVTKLGHDYHAVVTEPSCTEVGYTTHTCSRCADTYVDCETAELGHAFGSWRTTVEATCTEDGEQRRDCSRCDHSETKVVTKLGHDYHAVVTEPSCTEGGYTTHTCSRCGDRYNDSYTDPVGHSWDKGIVTKEPTEEEEGTRVFTCTVCGETRTESIPTLDHEHKYTAVVTTPTCTEAGYTTYTCKCGDSYRADELPPLGHTEESVPGKAATCTESGLTDGVKCSVCGEILTAQEEIPAKGHTEEIIPGKAATCTESGLTDGVKCSVCGEILTAQEEIPAKGHTEETIPGKAATCTESGLTDGVKCSVCGEILTAQEEIPAKGHTEETIPGKAATCTEPGLTEGVKCSVCDEILNEQEAISPLGHDFKDGTCTVCGEGDPDFEEPDEPTEPEVPTDPVEPADPTLSGVIRIAGSDRIGTSLMLAEQLKEVLGLEKFQSVIVASALNFPDALTGSYLAAVKNAPILLTYDAAHSQIRAYIQANLVSGGTVYILGGEGAVSADFVSGLYGFNIKRVAGSDRFGTNLEIMKEAGVRADQPVLIATALNFADSLSASAAGLPMMLVYGTLRPDQKEFLATTSRNFIIIGGTSAVSEELEAELKAIGSVERLAGAGRYQTSVMVAQRFIQNPDDVVLAYARNFPDGLCGGPLAYALGAPLILTDNYDSATADAYVDDIAAGIVVGGDGLISDSSVRSIFDLPADTTISRR